MLLQPVVASNGCKWLISLIYYYYYYNYININIYNKGYVRTHSHVLIYMGMYFRLRA
jgi:hypothetical protein